MIYSINIIYAKTAMSKLLKSTLQIVIGSLFFITRLRNQFAGAPPIHVNPNRLILLLHVFQKYLKAPYRKVVKFFYSQMYANHVADSAFIAARDVCPTSSASTVRKSISAYVDFKGCVNVTIYGKFKHISIFQSLTYSGNLAYHHSAKSIRHAGGRDHREVS